MEDSRVKLRRCKSARPDLTRRTRTETHWDPLDPVVQARIQPLGPKHWSQMKAEAAASCSIRKDISAGVSLPGNGIGADSSRNGAAAAAAASAKSNFTRPKTAALFDTAPRIHRSPLPNSPSWLSKLNTGYNQRARMGFVYWFTARPKPTQYGRYSIGAKHMQYGLCMAPRS